MSNYSSNLILRNGGIFRSLYFLRFRSLLPTLIALLGLLDHNKCFAGRESHGILPTQFVCQNSSKTTGVEFTVESNRIVSSQYKFQGKIIAKLSCEDWLENSTLSRVHQMTAQCGAKQSASYRFDLWEKDGDSYLNILKLSKDGLETFDVSLPCRHVPFLPTKK